jgi:serine/threonine protein kinase
MKHACVAHRSLKCENILVDKNDKIKNTDFGIAAKFDKADENLG